MYVSKRSRSYLYSAVLLTATALSAQTPALNIRLLTPISSRTSKPGAPLSAIVVAPLVLPDGVIPVGTLLHGSIRRAKAVGLGIVRETAHISFDFDRLQLPDGRLAPIHTRLAAVDNARERVDKKGVVRGIRATNS